MRRRWPGTLGASDSLSFVHATCCALARRGGLTVDKNRFDGFTRQLAKRENRRQALKTLFAGGAGTAAAMIVGKETEAAKPGGSTACCPADHPALCGLTC